MSAWRAGLVAVLGMALVPCAPSAQATFTVKPSVTLAVVSDSNLFARPTDPQSDVVSRVSPAIDAEYRSPRLTVLGRSTVDAERFAGTPASRPFRRASRRRSTFATRPHAG